MIHSTSSLFGTILTCPCPLPRERGEEEENRRKEDEERRKWREEDVKRRREEEVKRRREVVARVCKQSKVTPKENESNGGHAAAPRSRKFLNLFANDSSQCSASGQCAPC